MHPSGKRMTAGARLYHLDDYDYSSTPEAKGGLCCQRSKARSSILCRLCELAGIPAACVRESGLLHAWLSSIV